MRLPELAKLITEHDDSSRAGPPGERQPRNRRSEPRLPSMEESTCIWIDSEGRHQSQPMEVLDRSPDGLGFRLSQRLEAGQTVWVEMDGGTFPKGVVCFCESDGESYRAGLLQLQQEPRRFNRQSIGGTATLSWMDRPAARVSVLVMVRDMTADGLQLEVAMAVPVSSVVRLSAQELECHAVTRYCRRAEGRYVIGIEFLRSPYDKTAPADKEH